MFPDKSVLTPGRRSERPQSLRDCIGRDSRFRLPGGLAGLRHRCRFDLPGNERCRPTRSRTSRALPGTVSRDPECSVHDPGRRCGAASARRGCGHSDSCRSRRAESLDAGVRRGSAQTGHRGRWRADYRYQSSRSPYCFSRRSRRSCASMHSVATGRASRRFTPIGSPVSTQYP